MLEHSINVINGPSIFLQLLDLAAPSYTIHGFAFCSIRYLLLQIAFYHRAIGGLGIAGIRVFCISFPFAVIHIGADKLVKWTSRMTCFLTLLFAVANYFETLVMAPEIIGCFFNESEFIDLKVAIYKFSSESYVQSITCYICLVFNVAEFLCYIILLVELFKLKSRQKNSVSRKQQKMKNRRNAVTTLGHFTSWSVEIIIFGFAQYFLVTSRETIGFNIWTLIYFQLFVPCINYVIFPTVQALTSKDLREHVFNLAWFKDMVFLCIPGQLNNNGNNVGGEVSQGIELQLLDNGNTRNYISGSKNDSKSTKSCIFPHEITAAITTRRFSL